MYMTTDIVAVILLLIFFWQGWRLGFVRSVIGPLAFGFSCIIAIFNYDLNSNIVHATLIVIFGTLLLSTLGNLFLYFLRRGVDPERRNYVFFGSRVLGSVISLCWNSVVAAVVILIITLLPAQLHPQLANVQSDIARSKTFDYINTNFLYRFPEVHNVYLTIYVFKDPARSQRLSELPEFKQFFANPSVQAITTSDEIRIDLNQGQIAKVLMHPAVTAILRDEGVMKILTRLSRKIYEEVRKEQEEKNNITGESK